MYLASLGKLALGSRLKALSDQFYAAADEVYRTLDAPIEARWLPVLRYLWETGPSTVTAVAEAIGQTHSAVSQLTDKLVRAGMVRRRRDAADRRRSVLTLTDKAHASLGGLGPIWCAVRRGVEVALEEQGTHLLDATAACERALAERPVAAAILAEHAAIVATPVEIVPFAPALRGHFYRLNAQWLERYFQIEAVDRAVLTEPERHILQPGGAIFFARLGEDVIGTCALLQEAPGVFELTKMAVDETFRGLGAGQRLLDACLAEFRRRKGRTLFLESNSRLSTALRMYEKAGFVMQPTIRPDSHYARADVYMVYQPRA
ncbi:helix-turn-helix domain-containing GNAT family N-acetyltransferase [Dyella sp.]|jgi:DNA-binding MarR family transcriptional regulator/GNAT superfamily N-acetyltransferase|uniref:bifunctional helix-turn-helix transcriptional regulator/GNAT family N-acetyltransferase n=1 Tax=Dyella sp. TaxID=1869338 RepID=UPI002D7908FA|nr:helix-turn-helix domain-containing GNAT family N-acetyltransferase [Dyella sp.]HET6431170.1 helix-turn-helix domain-containing GNAT family N-acetyltransferase [Dyella sp.]